MKKQEGSMPATKKDIKLAILDLEQRLDKSFDVLEKSLRIDFKLSILNLEQRIDGRYKLLDEKFTKRFDQVLTKLDPVIAEIENARLDREIGASQTSAIRETIEDHEKRIVKLETP